MDKLNRVGELRMLCIERSGEIIDHTWSEGPSFDPMNELSFLIRRHGCILSQMAAFYRQQPLCSMPCDLDGFGIVT